MMSDYRILVAEDDADIREEVCDFLSEEGFRCTCVQDGEAAREALQQGQFDLLITDFRMPRLDGFALLQWCRHARVAAAVIFMSAEQSLPPAENITLGSHGAAFLVKPFSLAQLEAAIQQFQQGKLRVPRSPQRCSCLP
jgi:two-component system alkaline phosphatase synthesis response regulator PhoP